jgi:hypothetical protein
MRALCTEGARAGAPLELIGHQRGSRPQLGNDGGHGLHGLPDGLRIRPVLRLGGDGIDLRTAVCS